MIARQIIFEGKVQGVGFRYTAREQAKGYDVTGEVENLSDGNVRMLLIGERDEVEDFITEFVEDSTMAHHIKLHRVTEVDNINPKAGFQII